jgi:conserved domain protein
MNSREFFSKVALMRQLQKEYFKTRSKSVLAECKAIERDIDNEIKRVNAIIGNQSKKQELFK